MLRIFPNWMNHCCVNSG